MPGTQFQIRTLCRNVIKIRPGSGPPKARGKLRAGGARFGDIRHNLTDSSRQTPDFGGLAFAPSRSAFAGVCPSGQFRIVQPPLTTHHWTRKHWKILILRAATMRLPSSTNTPPASRSGSICWPSKQRCGRTPSGSGRTRSGGGWRGCYTISITSDFRTPSTPRPKSIRRLGWRSCGAAGTPRTCSGRSSGTRRRPACRVTPRWRKRCSRWTN
jgi:hypothetical protein